MAYELRTESHYENGFGIPNELKMLDQNTTIVNREGTLSIRVEMLVPDNYEIVHSRCRGRTFYIEARRKEVEENANPADH